MSEFRQCMSQPTNTNQPSAWHVLTYPLQMLAFVCCAAFTRVSMKVYGMAPKLDMLLEQVQRCAFCPTRWRSHIKGCKVDMVPVAVDSPVFMTSS